MIWLFLLLLLVCITFFYLGGEDLREFDFPCEQSFNRGQGRNSEHDEVEASFTAGMRPLQHVNRSERLRLMREYMDNISEGLELDATITPVMAGCVSAEWVMAPGASSDRRVLYIHGGAFVMGSLKSHRNITSRLSAVANAAVLAIDYRLMPENGRMAGIEDCRSAYRWLLQNGPQGAGAAQRLFIAGDSAGGNLTLAMTAWLRDQQLRSPDAAIALSPITDSTFGSASLKQNLKTDAMLGPMFSKVMKAPRPLLWWVSWAQNRINPANPVVSPVYGHLGGLPPTLLQASEQEVLFDDARRYVNRAIAAGSPVRLQTWAHVPHVWQMFYPQLTEAREAWDEIEAFIAEIDAEIDARVGVKLTIASPQAA